MKVLCFHPALAPYRVDFFNLLAQRVDLEVAFLMENLKTQRLDQASLRCAAHFKCCLMTQGFEIKGRLWRRGVWRLIRETQPDVAIGYEASPITFFLCLLKKFATWKLWTSMDEAAVTVRARRGVRAWVRDLVLRNCDGVIVPSEEVAQIMRKINPKLKTAVVPIIHDAATIRKNATEVIAGGVCWRKALSPDWQKILLFVGRLVPVKNLNWLIDRMLDMPREVGLVLVGDGSEREALERKVVELQLTDRVRVVGKHEGVAVYAWMSMADVLVLPSTFEPFGAVVAEAMQWGTPVIVSDRVGAKTLVNKDNGVVYRHDDRESFFAGLQKVMKLKSGTDSILPVLLTDAVDNLVKEMSK